MSLPSVTITELDGALGILPTTAGRLFAVVGVASLGPTNVPATFASRRALVAAHGDGPAVEAAALYIERYGRPVVFVRTGASNPGSYPAGAAVVFAGTGTSVVSVDDVGTAPQDDYEFYFEVVDGGTIGVDGITFRWSLDGGRTRSPVTALGVATSFVFPGSGGTQINFAIGTLVGGDRVTFRGDAPLWSGAEIASALDALFDTAASWEICHVVGNLDATSFDVIDPKFTGALAAGRYRSWYGHTRMPDLGETEAAYLAALQGIFSSKATVHGSLCAGAAKMLSSVSGRIYRRPVSFVVAAREQSVSEEVNIADLNLGPLPGVSIRDPKGNADEHDEALNPGLDDARFTVLRTWEGIAGVYVNRPRVFSPEGSDFDLHTKRRVINLAHGALRAYFVRRLNRPIRVDAVSGTILEEDALEIESGARAALRSVLLAKPKASGIQVSVSRTDNLLSTKLLNGSARVIPLAYAEFIEIDLGFLNPALQVQTV